MHQFMIRLGYLLFGSLYYFHPDGLFDPHFNTDFDGKEYPNLLMRGGLSEQIGFNNVSIWKIHPTMLHFLKKFIEYMNLTNKEYSNYLENNFQPSGNNNFPQDYGFWNIFKSIEPSKMIRYAIHYSRFFIITQNTTDVTVPDEEKLLDNPNKRMSKKIGDNYEFE